MRFPLLGRLSLAKRLLVGKWNHWAAIGKSAIHDVFHSIEVTVKPFGTSHGHDELSTGDHC